MFRIRRVFDDILPVNKTALREVRKIFDSQFPDASPSNIEHLAERLRNPFKKRFLAILSVAENSRHRVTGFSIVLHEPELEFCYLDFLAAGKNVPGRGIGAALYESVRDEALAANAKGVFFECLSDDEDYCSDPKIRKVNAARLRFYEQYGARPIIGTKYETPTPGADTDNLPVLMWDDLDTGEPLSVSFARKVVKAILERKYSHLCSPEYVREVVASFRDNPVKIREPRYVKAPVDRRPATVPAREPIALVVNSDHHIHHIRERGYVESPVRIKAILEALNKSGLVEAVAARDYPMKHILAVHDADFVQYLELACANAPEGESVYPYIFPIRNVTRPPKLLAVRSGYYCIDTFTPINRHAFPAAKRSVDCVLTAADEVLWGRRIAYALVRPPGHHAERRSFGGFCYFSNSAIGAQYFCRYGKVAVVDVDYHHGNGQQDIFYERPDVLTVSIHGDPDFAYPYFTGFADERGAGAGEGFNLNIALPEVQDGAQYLKALEKAVQVVRKFEPAFLVIPLGLDAAKGDPTGTWSLGAKDFEANGRMLGSLRLPTLVVQEGGYRTRTLGTNTKSFLRGLTEGSQNA